MSEPELTPQKRQIVANRAHACCEYCRSQLAYSPDPFEVEHIIPRAKSGQGDEDNLAFACGGCNGHKHAKTAAMDTISGQMVSLFHPRRDRWHEHFEWSADLTLMLGLTSTGRATITALNMNRPGVVNLRRVLRLIGAHPPEQTSADTS